MAGLNPNNNEPAYLLGRLHATLEGLETAARGLDSHIDAEMFEPKMSQAIGHPTLTLKLWQSRGAGWLRKLGHGAQGAWSTRIAELVNRIDPNVNVVGDANQSLFIVGYHHQRASDQADAITTRKAGVLLGLSGAGSARVQLSRWVKAGELWSAGRDGGGERLWPRHRIEELQAARPGRGARTDRRATMNIAGDTERPMAIWSVVSGQSPYARAVQPELAGVTIPDEVLTWAEDHGLSVDNPDVYLLVTPADEADEVPGEIACRTLPMNAADLARVRAKLDHGGDQDEY